MVTLATAGGPSQSPPSSLTPPIPEQSWKEPPPPFLAAIFTQKRHVSSNIGRSTLTHVATYRPPPDTINSAVQTTMDTASLTPPPHAISTLLPSPPRLEVDRSTSTSSTILPAFVPITRRSDSRVTHGPTSKKTTTTHYISTLNPTKTKEKEYISSLHNRTQGETLPTVIPQRLTSDLAHQNESQPPSARPRQPRIVRVIRNTHTTDTPIHSHSQPAPITITRSSPTTVDQHAEPENAARSKPRLIVRIRRNIPPTPQKTNINPYPSADPSETHIRDSNTKSDTSSGTTMCLTAGRSNGRRRVVKVRRKGDLAPNLRHQQQGPTPTDHHYHSNDSPTPVVAPRTLPNITNTSGPHHAPPNLLTEHRHCSSIIDDNSCIITSTATCSVGSKHPADSPVSTTPNTAHGNMDLSGEISSRAMTYRSFLGNNSVPVVPASIWHHRTRKYHHHKSPHDDENAATRTPTATIIQDHSTKFGVAHAHSQNPTQYQHHRPLHDSPPYRTLRIPTASSPPHTDDGTIYRPPWPPPYGPRCCPTVSTSSVDPKPDHFWPTTQGQSGHRRLITRPSRPVLQASYCLAHSHIRPPLPSRTLSLHCVTIPTSLTEDKNLLRPP